MKEINERISVFLIGNPTHYINALDLIFQFPKKYKNRHLVLLTDFYSGIDKLNNLIGENFWNSTSQIEIRSNGHEPSHYKSWRRGLIEAGKILQKENYDELVVGNIGSPVHYAILLKFHQTDKKLTALDDGTPSINILNARKHKRDYWKFHFPGWKIFIKVILAFGMLLPIYKKLQNISFFTIFPLKASLKDEVIQNEMRFSKLNFPSKIIDPELVYFSGSQMIEKGLVSKETYLNSLQKIKNYYQDLGKRFIYITHRAQSREMLENIKKITVILDLNGPMEFELKSKTMAGELAGYFSSTLFTMRGMYEKINVTSFEFPKDLIIGSSMESKNDIISIYNAIANKKGIELIKIENL